MANYKIEMQENIELSPEYLYNYREKITEMITEKYREKCIPNKGLVLNIEIETIKPGIVSRINSYPNFKVFLKLGIIRPIEREKTIIKVSVIHENYLIGNIHTKIIVMVSGENLKSAGYKYTEKGYKKGKKIIEKDGSISVIIEKIKYKEDKEIMCIAKI